MGFAPIGSCPRTRPDLDIARQAEPNGFVQLACRMPVHAFGYEFVVPCEYVCEREREGVSNTAWQVAEPGETPYLERGQGKHRRLGVCLQ